jgi:hypothetical protein
MQRLASPSGIVGVSAPNLVELQRRLEHARRVRLTGWPVFLDLTTPGWTPYPHDDFVEAWVGRPIERGRRFTDPAHADFWRASREGKLYMIRGYTENGLADRLQPGTAIDVTLPIWRVGERDTLCSEVGGDIREC